MKTKSAQVKITDEEKGEFEAVFSTFGVIDSDGDVTEPTAFTDGAPVRVSAYNHASWSPGQLPAGKGVVVVEGNEGIIKGQFFMDTDVGRETFRAVKNMGDLQEWSYGFDVLDSESGTQEGKDVEFLKSVLIHEVSPVILGAGVNTRTLAAKGRNMKLTDHLLSVVTDIEGVTERASDVLTKRREQGKKLGSESKDALTKLKPALEELIAVLKAADDEVDETELDDGDDAGTELDDAAAKTNSELEIERARILVRDVIDE